MSRIHEALKKAAQEQSTQISSGNGSDLVDVEMGIHPTTDNTARQTEQKESVSLGPMADIQAEVLEHVTVLKPAPTVISRLVALTNRESVAAEKFRVLSTRIKLLRALRPINTVLITSCVPEEGKSFIAANLAVTLAHGKKEKVLVIAGDLRRPGLNSIFGFGKMPGLADYLESEADPADVLYRIEEMPLWYLPPGNSSREPTDLLHSDLLAQLMTRIASSFDWVLVDSPPMVPFADASIWARLADGILFVVRENKAPKALLKNTLENLDAQSILGVVFNQDREKMSAPDSYYTKYAVQLKNGKGGNGFRKY